MAGDFTLDRKKSPGGVIRTPSAQGYMDKVTDEQLVALIEQGVQNSVGDFLNSSDLARERQRATYEYAMVPLGHLVPNGVSSIVSSDTVEAVDAYTAIIGKLMFGNQKIARFNPIKKTPMSVHQACQAAQLVNYVVFKQNNGWEILNTWVKASLLWKNAIIKWAYVEDYEYEFEEYDTITQSALDEMLGEGNLEIVGDLMVEGEGDEIFSATTDIVYHDVRLRRCIDKSGVRLTVVEPESFRITRDANTLDDAAFVGIQQTFIRSDIRKMWPELSDEIDWDSIGEGSIDWATKYTEEEAARKRVVGEEYWIGANRKELYPLEANREITVVECWLKVDRDGDGIAELKHFILAGGTILHEEDCSMIPLASICPFEIPHEFFGLSMADMVRPSTLAQTAIIRGFLENVYLTNYSPKLADPNVVDFSALQNIKPKQIIATNGSPANAVVPMAPEAMHQGTVQMLQYLQEHKEQATGMSKAAQGLNDTLYVSGNSEAKLSAVQSATQLRIEYIARRFAETGFKRLVAGIYHCARKNLRKEMAVDTGAGEYEFLNPSMLPAQMDIYVDIDVGDHSNMNTLKKMDMIGTKIIPALIQAGAGGVVAPLAAANIAAKTLEAMDLDPLDYIVDYSSEEFKQKAEESRKGDEEAAMKQRQLAEKKTMYELDQLQANIEYTKGDVQNKTQDNLRQLFTAIDSSDKEWAKLTVDLVKEAMKGGIQDEQSVLKIIPPRRSVQELMGLAGALVGGGDLLKPQAPTPEQSGTPADMQMPT